MSLFRPAFAARSFALLALTASTAGLALAQEAIGAGPTGASGPAGAGAAPDAGSVIMQQLIMFVPIILIFYFLLIRPQQKRAKEHREMIGAIAKGDTVVTSGGLIGKVFKVDESELTLELADNVRVRLVRSMVVDVRGKGVPAAANDTKPA